MKISVIIPTYNEENCIKNSISSLLNQTEKDFEIIIIDDGSTDQTKKIIQEEKSKKIKLILGEHKGPGFSRNLGAKKAKGEILVFVDADMTFDKDYLKNLIKPLEENKKIIGTTHDYEIAMNTSKWVSEMWGKIRVKEKEGYGNSVIFRAFRKNKFLEFGGFNPKYGYADDQTFYLEKNIKPYVTKNTICYHRNPETLNETFKQARWIGASWKERFWFFKFPIINYISLFLLLIFLPILILLKMIKTKTHSKYTFKKILEFTSIKFYGYFIGIVKAINLGNVWK